MIRFCNLCGSEFKTYPSKLKEGKGKYCSKKCSDKVTLIKPGQRLSPETEIKPKVPIPESWKKKMRGHRPWNYNGGRTINEQGYVMVLLRNHPDADSHGYVREHRLVMEKHLGRYLTKQEVVHHRNGIRDDNRIENLELFSDNTIHLRFHREEVGEYVERV